MMSTSGLDDILSENTRMQWPKMSDFWSGIKGFSQTSLSCKPRRRREDIYIYLLDLHHDGNRKQRAQV